MLCQNMFNEYDSNWEAPKEDRARYEGGVCSR